MIGAEGLWSIKLVTITISVLSVLFIGYLIMRDRGFPTTAQVPHGFQIFHIQVEQPNPLTQSPGLIYIMVQDVEESKPRMYEFPYNRKNLEQAMLLKQMLQGGKRVIGKRKGGKYDKGGKGEQGQGKNEKGGGGGHEGSHSIGPFEFHELPPGKYPPK